MHSYFVEACHTRGSIRLATLVLIALALLAAPSAKADCILFRHSTGGAEYINLQGRNFFGSRFPLYADTDCQTRHPTHDSGWYLGGVAYASNSASARSICAAKHRAPIRGVSPVGNGFWRCDINGDQGAAPGTQGGESPDAGPGAGATTSTSASCAAAAALSLDGLRLRASDGLGSGIQFRRLDACGIGIQSVIDMVVLDAVDVWSNIGSGYQVCFPGRGRIVFLDAATAPRSVVHVDYSLDDGYTCARLDRAGTLVLVAAAETAETDETAETAETAATETTAARHPGTDDSVDSAITLENCRVVPRVNLRLRSAPWGRILAVIPGGTSVVAEARTKSWFNVRYRERTGWIAAWLADSDGACDWPAAGISD